MRASRVSSKCRTKATAKSSVLHMSKNFSFFKPKFSKKRKKDIPLTEFLTRPSLRKRCFVGFLTLVAVQGTGTLVINSV